MRPIKILGIAPYEGIASLMQQAAESCDDLQIDVHVGNLTAGAEIAAAQTAQEEYDVILSRGGTAEGSVDSTGVTVSGDTYADVELSSRMIRDLGGSIAMLAEDIPVRVSYRSNDNTTLLPSSAVRGAGDDRYVYTVQQTQSAFGVNSLVTQKQSVTVLAEAGGVASIQEDVGYYSIAYMEDRPINDGDAVMLYDD